MKTSRSITRRNFLSMTSIGIAASLLPLTNSVPVALGQSSGDNNCHKPNIIIILADDMGYGELGCYGQEKIKTPVLDELASKGMRFTDFYAGNTVCAPSRCCLMTGKHPGHATVRGNSSIGENDYWHRVPLRKDEKTIAEMMKENGYVTALFGKYHLEDPNDLSTWAHNRGFDYTCHLAWPELYATSQQWKEMAKYGWVNGKKVPIEEAYPKDRLCYDEVYTNFGTSFIKEHKDKPFFLFLSYKIPHAPYTDLNEEELYKDKGWPWVERRHAARITIQDKQIGRILNTLNEQGLEEDTFVFFTSDNGGHIEGNHDHDFFDSNGSLRGVKRDLYEGGLRVPTIAYWKGKIKPGQKSDFIGAFWDVLPTCADIAGAKAPEEIDGISFKNTLFNKPQQERDYLYWEFQLDGWWQELPDGGFRQAVRMGKWKAVRYSIDKPIELYDLETDIGEKINLADEYPHIVKKAEQVFKTARTEHPGFPYGGKVQPYKAMDRVKKVKEVTDKF